ncbi:5'-nucleotidase [Geodermatophilus obscurus]|uniref:5'-nucleotidase n=1 Tax=Geodermatophilus obscurus TaxID=1861 RepID=A0A1M7T7B7_9ACTN|nr:bifunctional metallophosphatase/5'-nucleotidase [Geodermatophilus obscurus]SHN66631.1 5'-nucleotidase [Geodermatophilus obscurus]
MRPTVRRATVAAAVTTTVAGLAVAAATSAAAAPGRSGDAPHGGGPVDVQLLALNDFHGALEPPSGSSGQIRTGTNPDGTPVTVPAGGSAYLATQLAQLAEQQEEDNTITVAAGDLIGASPLLSAAFHDEPTIEALGLAGLDYASVGNHEFDEGADELLRIQDGGCHPVDGCVGELEYDGADFRYLSANAFWTESGEPLLDPYAVHEVDGVEIGFIGMTLEGTADIVTQQGVAGLDFADEVETTNRYAAELQARGVEAIVVLLHEGGAQTGENAWDVDGCTGLTGPIVDIANWMTDAVDVVVSGHTHQAYNCRIDHKLVTSASSNGRLVTDIDLRVNRQTGDVIGATADNTVVTRDLAADPAQTELIARYRTALGPIANEVVGSATADITRTADDTGETPLGNLIADAQLADTRDEQAVGAFMNPGGVRADLGAGDITYEEAFTVQPFANTLVTLDLTGAQLDCLLEQQYVVERVLQPSATIRYTVASGAAAGTAADPCSGQRVDGLTVDGTPVDPAAVYRVTVNGFLADGGDGFTVLREGTNRVTTSIDLDAFVAYLGANSPVAPPATDRITAG